MFPHALNLEHDLPKFSALPPTPQTTGDWDEVAFPAGTAVAAVRDVKPATQIVAEMIAEARAGPAPDQARASLRWRRGRSSTR